MSHKYTPLTPERVAVLRASPVVRIRDAIQIYGFGRNKLYEFMKDGRVSYVKIGYNTLLRTESLERLVSPIEMEAAE
jgi:hypothetical protein